jgi:hypothetical protein
MTTRIPIAVALTIVVIDALGKGMSTGAGAAPATEAAMWRGGN